MRTGWVAKSWIMTLPVAVCLVAGGGCDEAPVVGDAGEVAGAGAPGTGSTGVVEVSGVGSAPGAVVGTVAGGGEESGTAAPDQAAVEHEPSEPPRNWTAQDAGFARHLPADTSWYLEARHLGALWGGLEQLGGGDVMDRLAEALDSPEALQEMADALGADGVNEERVAQMKALGREHAEDAWKVVRAGFGEEVFLSFRGLEWWAAQLESYQVESNRRMMALVTESLASGTAEELLEEDAMQSVPRQLLGEMRLKLREVNDRPVLGVQFGGKVAEDRAGVAGVLRGWMDRLVAESETAEAHSFQKGGTTWTGLKVAMSSLVDESWREDLEGKPDAGLLMEMADVFLGQDLVFAFGEVGDYVVFYAGLGEHSLEVEADPAKSLAAREDLGFLGEFPAEGLLGLAWSRRDLIGSIHRQGSWESVWRGVAEGLERSPAMASGPALSAAARRMADLTKERDEGVAHPWVGALILDEGLRLETRGGWQGKGLDLESPLAMAGAMRGRDDTLLLRAHWKHSEEHLELGVRQFEELVQMVRLIGIEIQASLGEEPADDGEGEGEDRRERMAEMYQEDLVRSVEDLWSGYREHFRKAVGGEAAVMIDLGGKTPPVPGLGEEVLKNGRIPRFAYLRPVKDRGELQETWSLWRASGVRILGMLSEAIEQPVPFPDTMSADKDDFRTHFFSMPFATDDFLPSLSVSDELFVVGSSKEFSEDLYETVVEAPAGGEPMAGVLVELRAAPLWDFCEQWLDVALREAELKAGMEEGVDDAGEGGNDAAGELPPALVDPGTDDGAEGLQAPAGPATDEAVVPDGAEEAPSALGGLLGGWNWADVVRQGIDQARWFRGASYRKWSDDGTPRSSTRLHWGDPMDLAD